MTGAARPGLPASCAPPAAGRGSDVAALLFVTAVVILAVVGGFLGADSRDGADWSPPRVQDPTSRSTRSTPTPRQRPTWS
jgi:hypothetical protein